MPISTLFIADISGFTKFVKQTEMKHSKHIIEELINLIVKKGSATFKVAEIEGDAVFFFKRNRRLSLEQIQLEAKRIYLAFHQHLLRYRHHRICDCGACCNASELGLKFVAHAGAIEFIHFVDDRNKPYGEPVIAAHRLLKSNINHSEHLLFTDDLSDEVSSDGKGFYQDETLGKIGFSYLTIDHWRKELRMKPKRQFRQVFDLVGSANNIIPFHIDIVHEFIHDFRFRSLWNQEADEILFDENKINQVGAEHYCIIKGQELFLETIKPQGAPGQKAYGEVLKNPNPLQHFESNFFLTPREDGSTLLELKLCANFRWMFQKLLTKPVNRKLTKKASKVITSIYHALSVHYERVAVTS